MEVECFILLNVNNDLNNDIKMLYMKLSIQMNLLLLTKHNTNIYV